MESNDPVWKFKKELHAGTSSLAVMGILIQSKTPMYGYEIGILLDGLGEHGLPMNHGALYPVLRSLEKQGLLTSEVEPSTSGPPRRYYRPTSAGRAAFSEWKKLWMQTRDWLEIILEQKHGRRSRTAEHRS